jgi:hypothetical protein
MLNPKVVALIGASFHDQLYLAAGRLRNGPILRSNQPDRFPFCIEFKSRLIRFGLHPSDCGSWRVSVEIARHPTGAEE